MVEVKSSASWFRIISLFFPGDTDCTLRSEDTEADHQGWVWNDDYGWVMDTKAPVS